MALSLNITASFPSTATLPNYAVTQLEIANSAVTARIIDRNTVTTDYITEGSANLYFTNARARDALTVTGGASYDSSNGILSVGGPGLWPNTDNVAEGSANLYFTNARARAAISAFDNSIIYDDVNGTIKANLAAIGAIGGGPNVISVNGQVGLVYLTTLNIIESGDSKYFSNALAQAAISGASGILVNDGTISIDDTVDILVNNITANSITLVDQNNALANVTILYDANSNYITVEANIRPTEDNVFTLGTAGSKWNEINAHELTVDFITATSNITTTGDIVARNLFGNITGEVLKTITITATGSTLIIDTANDPDLFLPQGTVVDFNASSDSLIGIGFDIGIVDGSNVLDSSNITGISYTVGNDSAATYADWEASFTGPNTRVLSYVIPQGASSNLIYYATSYENSRGRIVTAPPFTTDDLTEGNQNLYYTDERVQAVLSLVVDANVGMLYDEVLNIISLEQNIGTDAGPIFANVTANAFFGGNFYGTFIGNIQGAVANLNHLTTDDLAEGSTNRYYTTDRVRTAVFAGPGLTYSSITGEFELPFTGVDAGTYGNPNAIAKITVDDFGRITSANSIGILINSANVLETSNVFFTNARVWANVAPRIAELTTTNIAEGANLYFTNARARAAIGSEDANLIYYENNGKFQVNVTTSGGGAVTSVNGQTGIVVLTTANIAEDSNLYFTTDRVWANIGANIGNLNFWVASHNTTTGIAEGTKLFFTNARARAAIQAADNSIIYYEANGGIQANLTAINSVSSVNGQTGTVVLTTSNVYEGANLYFTNTRTRAAVGTANATALIYYEANGNFQINVEAVAAVTSVNEQIGAVSLSTSNIAEGANLYFTNTRSRAAVGTANSTSLIYYEGNGNFQVNIPVVGGVNSVNGQTGVVSLTTTNIAEGDNLYFTNARVWSNIASRISELTTSNIAEGANLYFTNARVWSNVGPRIAELTTSNIAEGSNLYFTNARTRAAISGGTGVTYIQANGQINIGQDVSPTTDVEFRNIIITGNLKVQGTQTIINASQLAISDNMVYLNESTQQAIANAVGDGANVVYTTVQDHGYPVGTVVRVTDITPNTFNQTSYVTILATTSNTFTIANATTDTYVSGGNAFGKSSINPDLGWAGGYNDGTYHHAGMFRDATDGVFKVFDSYTPEPDANIYIDTAHISFRLANLAAKEFIGPVIGNVSSLANHTTSNLVEGANLYFTNARSRATVGTANSSTLIYYEANGNFQVNTPVVGGVNSVNGQTGVVTLTTSNIDEGSNLYFTNARARAAVGTAAANAKGLSYVESTGEFSLADSGATSGIYGTASLIPQITVDRYGRITAVSNIASISGVSSVNGQTDTVVLTTANIAESGNLYFTSTRARAAVGAVGSNLTYYEANGNYQITMPGSNQQIIFNNGGQLGTSGSLTWDGSSLKATLLESTQSSGDEGGQLTLANAATNSTLNGPIAIDIYQNRLRIFETGGSNRGAFIPLDAASTGVGSNLLAGGGGGSVSSVNGQTGAVVLTTANVAESGNLYFTNARARAAITTAAANAKGLSYVESTGEFSLADSGATSGIYGTASLIPQITVDRYGRITAVSNVAAAGGGASSNSFSTIVVAGGSNVVATSPTDTLTLVAGGNVTITTDAVTDTITISAIAGGGGAGGNPFDQDLNTANAVQFSSLGIGTPASGTTGEIRATNNITAYYSDDRLKKKLGNIENALDKIRSLQGFYYQANEVAQSLGYDVRREVGLSAQQVQRIMPEVVTGAPIDQQYLTIWYERLIPLIVEAIKEVKEELDQLKRKDHGS